MPESPDPAPQSPLPPGEKPGLLNCFGLRRLFVAALGKKLEPQKSPEDPESKKEKPAKQEPMSDERRKKNERIVRQALEWSEFLLSVLEKDEDPGSVSTNELLRRCGEKLDKDTQTIVTFGKYLVKAKIENAAQVIAVFQLLFKSQSKILDRDDALRAQMNRMSVRLDETIVAGDDPSVQGDES